MPRERPTWVLIVIIFVLILALIFLIVVAARNVVFPLGAGRVDSGVVAAKRLQSLKNSEEYKFVAVMVEPRTDHLMETLEHYRKVLPEDTHFQVYHGTKNETLLRESHLAEAIREGTVELFNMGVENLTSSGYSRLLCSIAFWETIRSEKVLIFQTDSVTCGQSSYTIEQFMDYDYVGAPLPAHVNTAARFLFLCKGYHIHNDFYNGGLSLRSRSKSIEVLKRYPWDEKTPEDLWFCAFLPRVGGRLPDRRTAREFAYEAENAFKVVPWGIHKPRKNKGLLQHYCPEHTTIPFLPAHTDYRTLYFM